MNIDKKALKSIVDEIEASRLRQKAETEHQREVMKRDYYVHAYELALGGKKAAIEALEGGATVREAAEAGGISTGAAGNLAQLVQKSPFMDGHDPAACGASGAIGDDCSYPNCDCHMPEPASEMTIDDLGTADPVREMVDDDLGDPLLLIDKSRAQFREKVRTAAASVKVTRVVEPPPPRYGVDDPLEIPHFLRRVPA